MKLNDDEILIKKGSANHLVQFEGVGGRLFLTNQRLFFKSHSFNIQTHEESILLDDIISIETEHRGLFFRMFSILLKNGSVERFVVRDRKTWASEIEKAIEALCKKNGIYRDIHKKVGYKVPPISNRSIIKTAIQATVVAICIAVLIYVFL